MQACKIVLSHQNQDFAPIFHTFVYVLLVSVPPTRANGDRYQRWEWLSGVKIGCLDTFYCVTWACSLQIAHTEHQT